MASLQQYKYSASVLAEAEDVSESSAVNVDVDNAQAERASVIEREVANAPSVGEPEPEQRRTRVGISFFSTDSRNLALTSSFCSVIPVVHRGPSSRIRSRFEDRYVSASMLAYK